MLNYKYETEVQENNGHRKDIVKVRFDKENKMLEEFFGTEIRNFKMAVYAILNEIDECDRSWLSFNGNRFHMLVSRKVVYIDDNYQERPGITVATADLRDLVYEYIEKTTRSKMKEQ